MHYKTFRKTLDNFTLISLKTVSVEILLIKSLQLRKKIKLN